MAAEIKNFQEEKSRARSTRDNYKERIKKHKKIGFYRILLAVLCILVLLVIIIQRYSTHIYTTYEVLSTIPVQKTTNSVSIPIGNQIFTYSTDGAHSTNAKGEIVWNQTFEMQHMIVTQNGDTIAMADYNGREVYVFTPKGKIGEIHTTMPIRNFAVSENGRVAVAVTDSKITWIYIYDSDGTMKYEIKTTMGQSGYPASFSLSPNGELLAMSCIYVDSGVVKSRVAFYNFGDVGENKSDYYMSGSTFPDTIIPLIRFMDDDSIYAVGDDRVMLFGGNQIPELNNNFLFEEEIKSVYNNKDHVIAVFGSDKLEYRRKMVLFSGSSEKRKEIYTELEFTNVAFGNKYFTIYNDTRCQVYTYGGKQKYNGTFDQPVRLMIPIGGDGSFRYLIMTDMGIDTIQLK